jgi:hypothetical protein
MESNFGVADFGMMEGNLDAGLSFRLRSTTVIPAKNNVPFFDISYLMLRLVDVSSPLNVFTDFNRKDYLVH